MPYEVASTLHRSAIPSALRSARSSVCLALSVSLPVLFPLPLRGLSVLVSLSCLRHLSVVSSFSVLPSFPLSSSSPSALALCPAISLPSRLRLVVFMLPWSRCISLLAVLPVPSISLSSPCALRARLVLWFPLVRPDLSDVSPLRVRIPCSIYLSRSALPVISSIPASGTVSAPHPSRPPDTPSSHHRYAPCAQSREGSPSGAVPVARRDPIGRLRHSGSHDRTPPGAAYRPAVSARLALRYDDGLSGRTSRDQRVRESMGRLRHSEDRSHHASPVPGQFATRRVIYPEVGVRKPTKCGAQVARYAILSEGGPLADRMATMVAAGR